MSTEQVPESTEPAPVTEPAVTDTSTTVGTEPAPTTPPTEPADPTEWLRSAPVPSLCDSQAGNLVDGALPPELLAVDSSALIPLAVTLLDEPPRAQGQLGGQPAFVATVLCVYPSYGFPEGFQSLVAWDGQHQLIGAVAVGDVVERVTAEGDGFDVEWTSCTPDIQVCVPDGTHRGRLTTASGGIRLDENAGGSGATAPQAVPATCISLGSMTVGMKAHRPEIALLQLTLKNLGYDPGAIDGYFGEKTLVAAIDESRDHASSGIAEYGIDEQTILDSMFKRLGIAC